jgi:hypothetical protein
MTTRVVGMAAATTRVVDMAAAASPSPPSPQPHCPHVRALSLSPLSPLSPPAHHVSPLPLINGPCVVRHPAIAVVGGGANPPWAPGLRTRRLHLNRVAQAVEVCSCLPCPRTWTHAHRCAFRLRVSQLPLATRRHGRCRARVGSRRRAAAATVRCPAAAGPSSSSLSSPRSPPPAPPRSPPPPSRLATAAAAALATAVYTAVYTIVAGAKRTRTAREDREGRGHSWRR